MGNNKLMDARDSISASLAECYATIEGNRYNFMQAINLEAKMEITKTEIPILGKTGKGNKPTGWKGTVILKDCCMDGGILAKFDADGEYLDEEMDFTFEDWEMPEEFKMLAGMQ